MSTNLVVEVYDGNVEGALKHFKSLALKAGLFKEIKRHNFYLKPGERRRLKSKKARAQLVKAARRKATAEAEYLRRRGQTDD
jgi:small subunit ribosomal protein S21